LASAEFSLQNQIFYFLLCDAINMASTSEIHSENFDDNNSFEVNTLSALLSGVETEANTSSIPTTRTT
jgi:hypothetical protein